MKIECQSYYCPSCLDIVTVPTDLIKIQMGAKTKIHDFAVIWPKKQFIQPWKHIQKIISIWKRLLSFLPPEELSQTQVQHSLRLTQRESEKPLGDQWVRRLLTMAQVGSTHRAHLDAKSWRYRLLAQWIMLPTRPEKENGRGREVVPARWHSGPWPFHLPLSSMTDGRLLDRGQASTPPPVTASGLGVQLIYYLAGRDFFQHLYVCALFFFHQP